MWEFFAQVDTAAVQEQVNTAVQQQEQMFAFIKQLQERVLAYLPFIIGASLVLVVFMAINAVNKMRVDKAILRIDKNLQKLISEHSIKSTIDTEGGFPNMYATKPTSGTPEAAPAKPDTGDSQTPPKGWYE